MVLPIVAYGLPVLRKKCQPINTDYPELQKLIANMWDTLYNSNGVGIAAPQVNKDIRIFLVDTAQIFKNAEEGDEECAYPDKPGIKQTFINAEIINYEGKEWSYNEGCLSIPKIREDVMRPESLTISYLDENFISHTKTYNGLSARVIQHEYDHIEGKLFIDYLKPLKKKLLQRRLNDISKGKVQVDYRMLFGK